MGIINATDDININSQQTRDDTKFNSSSQDWTSIDPSFSQQSLIDSWVNKLFTYSQTKEWIKVDLITAHDANFSVLELEILNSKMSNDA